MKSNIILIIILTGLFKLSGQQFDFNNFYRLNERSFEENSDSIKLYGLKIALQNDNQSSYALIKWSKNKKIDLLRSYNNSKIEIFNDVHNDNELYNTSLIFTNNEIELLIEARIKGGLEKEDIQLEIFQDEKINNKKLTSQLISENCLCSTDYQNRIAWDCPWGEGSENFTPEYSKLTHFVIHHQGGIAQAPYANVVKAIWNFHVYGNGWSDIGYHWLIDPNGVIYKGRAWLNGDENVKGAHTCACNSNKIGICLLGNHNEEKITDAQYTSLKKFIAIKSCGLKILPNSDDMVTTRTIGICESDTFATISGHRDICGSGSTDCPGNKFYPLINQLILEIENEYLKCVDTLNTGFEENEFKRHQIEIYPNPNSSELFEISGIEGDFILTHIADH